MAQDINKIVESLSPLERKVIPFLDEEIDEIIEKSGLDRVSVLRALEFLNSKGVISLKIEKKRIVDLGTNGVYYLKKGLPERRLLEIVESKILSISEAQKESKLSANEFKAALGALKKRALIELKSGKIHFSGSKEEVGKKTLEELFLDALPKGYEGLSDEEKFAFSKLKDRKDIVELRDEQSVSFSISDFGRELMALDFSKAEGLLEELTPEMLKSGSWKGKRFRRYDVTSQVPKISGGKRHFVAQATDYGRRIWSEMGFEEMSGSLLQSSFWNFDALFTAQDHPVREMQDTFFLDGEGELPDKKLVAKVKKAHEVGVDNSKGWGGDWNVGESKKIAMRTHTTCLSVQKLSELKMEGLPKKFFALGKCFRNETVDWSHGFEFNQTEGIVVDRDANFRHLLGYLEQFFKKMGLEKIRFRPAYFPYTEPSVEIDVFHSGKQKWLELGGAGIFRPEVVVPLLGEFVPVLAWGPGFDRVLMDYYDIKDLRELYKNDLLQLRKMKVWKK
tara:strand:- start:6337 stop:7851 length:1515 start_codon:yes stop_codon:yes gene_type:complete